MIIQKYVFSGCISLRIAKLSENITEISDGKFNSCSLLSTLIIPENVE